MEEDVKTQAVEAPESFEQMLEESFAGRKMQVEEVCRGTVIKITSDYVIVDVGCKSEGQIPIEEFKNIDNQITVKVGDEIDVFIDGWENENGMMQLSKDKADRMRVWDTVSKVYDNDGAHRGKDRFHESKADLRLISA